MSVTTASIFKSFLGAGMISFGGAMPHVQKLVVEKQKWIHSRAKRDQCINLRWA